VDSAGTFQQTMQTFGGNREEVGEVNGLIVAWNGQGDADAACSTAFGYLASIEAAVRADPTLGLTAFDYVVAELAGRRCHRVAEQRRRHHGPVFHHHLQDPHLGELMATLTTQSDHAGRGHTDLCGRGRRWRRLRGRRRRLPALQEHQRRDLHGDAGDPVGVQRPYSNVAYTNTAVVIPRRRATS
jgi:hypothetical protein